VVSGDYNAYCIITEQLPGLALNYETSIYCFSSSVESDRNIVQLDIPFGAREIWNHCTHAIQLCTTQFEVPVSTLPFSSRSFASICTAYRARVPKFSSAELHVHVDAALEAWLLL